MAVAFATVNDEGKPEIRIIDVMIVEKDKLYFCTGRGKCMSGCPQQCITKGIPFLIHQEHCLHCGLCFENCPVQAIVRRGA